MPTDSSLPDYTRTEICGSEFVFFSWVIYTSLVVVVTIDEFLLEVPVLRPLLTIMFLLFVPGILIVIITLNREVPFLNWIIYSAGLSLILTMALGVAASTIGVMVGINRPISTGWILFLYGLIICFLTAIIYGTPDISEHTFSIPVTRELLNLKTWAFLLFIPISTVLGVMIINYRQSNFFLIVVLVGISLIPFAVSFGMLSRNTLPLLVFSIALSLLYHNTLWSKSYPIEIWMGYFTKNRGYWLASIAPRSQYPKIMGAGQESVLSDGIVFPVYAVVSDISFMTQLEVINPLFVVLIPLTTFAIARTYLGPRDAFLTTLFLIFSFRFYEQHYPNAARDVSATIFISMLGLITADRNISSKQRGALSIVFITGVIVTHYGTAYILLFIFIFSVVAKYALRKANIKLYSQTEWISIKTVIVTTSIAFCWYFLTGGGSKFYLLKNVVENILLGLNPSGPTTRLIRAERSITIDLLKLGYVIIVGLTGVGVLSALYQEINNKTTIVETDHLFISTGMVGILFLSVFPVALGFDTGRIIMIFLPFLSLFIVWILRNGLNSLSSFTANGNHFSISTKSINYRIITSVILAFLLLMSTGVTTELVTHDYAPSNTISEERLLHSDNKKLQWRAHGCRTCDINQLVWILNYGNETKSEYTDVHGKGWYWFAASVTSKVDGFVSRHYIPGSTLVGNKNMRSTELAVSSGDYIRLHNTNIRTGQVWLKGGGRYPISQLNPSPNNMNKIYSNGNGEIYSVPHTNISINAT